MKSPFADVSKVQKFRAPFTPTNGPIRTSAPTAWRRNAARRGRHSQRMHNRDLVENPDCGQCDHSQSDSDWQLFQCLVPI